MMAGSLSHDTAPIASIAASLLDGLVMVAVCRKVKGSILWSKAQSWCPLQTALLLQALENRGREFLEFRLQAGHTSDRLRPSLPFRILRKAETVLNTPASRPISQFAFDHQCGARCVSSQS